MLVLLFQHSPVVSCKMSSKVSERMEDRVKVYGWKHCYLQADLLAEKKLIPAPRWLYQFRRKFLLLKITE